MPSKLAVVFRQHLRAEMVGEYVLLPFEVPAGTTRIDIRYSYDQDVPPVPGAPPGNAVDLGLFGPGGAGFCTGDFRGWSGTARQEVFVTSSDATPGYLPGPITPGTWHVLLGLYMLHPSGCDYTVQVHLSQDEQAEHAQPLWPTPQARRQARWYPGDLHSHSHHSEASGTLADLCEAAMSQGLAFLAVTEHNTVSHHRLLGQFRRPDFLPIPGQEITTYRGHANVWGADRWIEFRCRRDADLTRVISMAHAAGGLFSANHPKTNGPPWQFGTYAGIDCLEVWQGPWFLSNYQSLAVWDDLLRSGQRVVGVGGSDQHQPAADEQASWHCVGHPTTWVYAPALDQAAILAGVRAGHVAISAGPAGPQLEMRAQAAEAAGIMGDLLTVRSEQPVQITGCVRGGTGLVLRLMGPKGMLAEMPITDQDWTFEYPLTPRASTYVRAEVAEPLDPAEAHEPAALVLQALGNPIYVQVVSSPAG